MSADIDFTGRTVLNVHSVTEWRVGPLKPNSSGEYRWRSIFIKDHNGDEHEVVMFSANNEEETLQVTV